MGTGDYGTHQARHAALVAEHGKPEHMPTADALDLARSSGAGISPYVTAPEVHASVYRDDAAADAYLESDRVHYGHPTLARVPLGDGRVLGILDLRPALRQALEGNQATCGCPPAASTTR